MLISGHFNINFKCPEIASIYEKASAFEAELFCRLLQEQQLPRVAATHPEPDQGVNANPVRHREHLHPHIQ